MAITFKSVLAAARALLQSKTVTAGTSDIVVQPDSGYDGLSQVTVEPTPSTAITPSNSSPAAMTSGQRYTPGANGYAIESYASITPSASGAAFSAGINKMSAAGYAYSARPSGGVLRTIATQIVSSTYNNFTSSGNWVDCTNFNNYANWSTNNFLIVPDFALTYQEAKTAKAETGQLHYADALFYFDYDYEKASGKLRFYCYLHNKLYSPDGQTIKAERKTPIRVSIYYYES